MEEVLITHDTPVCVFVCVRECVCVCTRMFCRFQHVSLMFTLRSKVTQQRLKNLKQKHSLKLNLKRNASKSMLLKPLNKKKVQGSS